MPLLRRAPVSLARARYTRYSSSKTPVVVGLRQEDPGRLWERRSPLTPDTVADLVGRDGVRVLVQDCEKRVFPIDDYIYAGAEIHPTLEPAHLVMGIKETPLSTLITSPVPSPVKKDFLVPRTHLMFSHTIKGQDYNMSLLSRFLKGGDAYGGNSGGNSGLEARLIDYELLTDGNGKRTVAFGFFAGVAGALESLAAMAHKHLERGVASPFLYTPRPHTSPSLDSHRAQLRYIGRQIIEHGTPESLGPCIIGVTGNGNVTEGTLSILSELPIVKVSAEDLPSLVNSPGVPDTNLRKVYVVHALPSAYITRTDGAPYDRSDYYANPHVYQSHFHTKIAPYLTLLINGAGWTPAFPRLLTTAQLPLATRLAAVGDISCDIEGGLEFVTHATTLDSPTFDVGRVAVMSVDILPASLPADASAAFAGKVSRYVRALVNEYRGLPVQDEEAIGALRRASVASGGKVREGFEWLGDKVDAWRTQQDEQVRRAANAGLKKKKVLVLGSGMVAGPAVDELASRSDVEVIVASNSLQEAKKLVAQYDNAKAVLIDINQHGTVSGLVAACDVVVSLLPAPFHPSIAEMCIQHKKHLVTASYISPAMHGLHSRAQDADVLLLNEIGLDPGIDHCSAHSLITRLKAENKRLTSFTSFCGGLPAPEAAEGVPLGYKFSWSPRGVLRAAGEGARFLLEGKVREIPGDKILLQHFPDVPVSNVLRLEGLANRDSIPYKDIYQLPDAQTVLRGTLRYPGFAALMHSFKTIGLLEPNEAIMVEDWSSFTRLALQQQINTPIPSDRQSLLDALSDVLQPQRLSPLVDALSRLGLMPSPPGSVPAIALPPVSKVALPPADLLALHLAHVLRYEPHERDLVLLAHEVVAEDVHGRQEIHTSTMTVYGDEKASAMARTVGYPVAFAALKVLDGKVRVRGVCGPTAEDALWMGVLEGLERKGLECKEAVKPGRAMKDVLVRGLEDTVALTQGL
ncbi:Saccharopine dehydrogenase-domain-containing protein [Amylostereum chailletii]|nr:Saccharopine dehydrogenase-domain-containing protein [Amylostereum chailletii]